MTEALPGGCLCGAVRYEACGPFEAVGHCHCIDCRKAQGAAFATNASVRGENFRLLSGGDQIDEYESAPGKFRCFCRVCGSSLFARFRGTDLLRIRLGTLEGDPGVRPVAHIFTGQRAAWEEIDDDLPQFEAEPPPFEAEPPRA